MAMEGGRKRKQQQQQQQEAEQQQQKEQQEPAVGGLRSVGSPAAGSDVGSGDAGAGEHRPPVHPLLAIPVPQVVVGLGAVRTSVDVDHRCGAPHGWQRCLDLKSGKNFYRDPFNWEDDDMSRNGKNPRLDLRLNMSGHRGSSSGVAGGSSGNNNNNNRNTNNNNNNNNRGGHNNSAHQRSSSSSPPSPASPPSSCVSSETEQEEEPSSMVLVGCPHCLMYVMLSSSDPRCPKCKSTVLLDFLNDPKNTGGAASSTRKSKKN